MDGVVSSVVYRFQYFHKLSPGGNVVVSAVAHRFKFSRNSHLGLLLLYLLLFACYNISRNSHLGLLLLYLLVLTGVVAYDVVHRFQYFQELSTGMRWLYLLLLIVSSISKNSHLWMVLYLLLFTGSNVSRNFYLRVMLFFYRFQYLQELSPGGGDVVSAVVNMFQYFQGLLPVGDVVVSAVVYRFQYFQELSPLSAVVLILGRENFLGSPVFLSKNNKTLHIEIAGKSIS